VKRHARLLEESQTSRNYREAANKLQQALCSLNDCGIALALAVDFVALRNARGDGVTDLDPS
jgi:hypothetical protein